MTETTWLVLYAIASGLFGRIAKAFPKVPKTLLPWIVMVAGYAISVGMGVYNGMPLQEALASGWSGLAAGLLAVGGHEALKPFLSKILGEQLTTKILGKLPKAEPKPAEAKK